MTYKDYVKWKRMPTTWCPGCSLGMVYKQLAIVLDELKIKKEDVVVVSGIGCSGRAAGYFDFDTVHTTHGRALSVAEGIKRGNDKLNVIVFSGDGDLTGIGGNHLLHTSRRNVNLTVICNSNEIYGMTGGQMAPTTKKGVKTLTSPRGNEYAPINLQGLMTINKQHFYARSSAYQLDHLQKCIKESVNWDGFSFIEVASYCIENHGRRLGYKNASEMLEMIKKKYKINREPGDRLGEEELGIIRSTKEKNEDTTS